MSSTITFTPESVKAILLDAGFTEYDWNTDDIGFTVWAIGGGLAIAVRMLGVGTGEGLCPAEEEYARALEAAGYEVRSTGSEVVVAGVKGADR
jgi:hypothetical protein